MNRLNAVDVDTWKIVGDLVFVTIAQSLITKVVKLGDGCESANRQKY